MKNNKLRRLPESIRQRRLSGYRGAAGPWARAPVILAPSLQECAMQLQTMAAEKLSPAAPPADAAIAID
ncbi:MAG: hypothetical protein E5V67_29840, partial [Mesorhizobium sp.]